MNSCIIYQKQFSTFTFLEKISLIGVTPAMTDLLTTPQSGGQVPRIGHESSTEQPQELPASQRDQADDDVMQLNERMAQTAHSARKRKECPTAAEQ